VIIEPLLTSPIIASVERNQVIERRSSTSLKIQLTLIDGSTFHVTENHIFLTGWIDYSYHWQTADHQIIHRWDNAHPVPLPTSPFHQHISSEENVQPSEPMTLAQVLTIIAQRITSGS